MSVFCDLIGKRVLFATEGKDKGVWESFVSELDRHDGHPRAITEVSIDMSPAYIAGVKKTRRPSGGRFRQVSCHRSR